MNIYYKRNIKNFNWPSFYFKINFLIINNLNKKINYIYYIL